MMTDRDSSSSRGRTKSNQDDLGPELQEQQNSDDDDYDDSEEFLGHGEEAGTTGSSSSVLRTHLMEAQILDSQFEMNGEEETGLAELIAEDKENQIDGAAVLNEMDDAIIRLRKWQLEREFQKLEVESQLQEQRLNEKNTSIVTDLDSTTTADDDYEHRRSASKKSLETMEALLRANDVSPDRRIDLSILNEQDIYLASESLKSLEVDEQLGQEINEAACRRMREEVLFDGDGLEADVTALTAQLMNFSSELDSLLLQADDSEITTAATATTRVSTAEPLNWMDKCNDSILPQPPFK